MFNMNKFVCVSILLYFVFVISRQISAQGLHPEEVNDEKTRTSRLTQYQQAQLEKFRTVVADLLDDDYERSDEYLLGFLKSRKWEVFSAKQMLKMAKIWEEGPIHNLRELANTNFPPEMLTYFPVKLDGYDKMGCPITQVYFGSWNVADYISKQESVRDGVQNFMKYIWQLMAKVDLRNRFNFPNCHQTRAIVTFKNYNMTHFSDVNSISTVVRMITDYANYAPSIMYAANILEVPGTIKPLLELLRTNVNDELYGLFKIHEDGKWKHELHNLVEVDQLGRKLGGTADDI